MSKDNKVSNTKEPLTKGIKMNDSDYLNVLLTIEKNMSNNYSIALNEASNNSLYEDYYTMFNNTKDLARETFNVIFRKGWYILEKSEDKKIKETITKLETEIKDMEKN